VRADFTNDQTALRVTDKPELREIAISWRKERMLILSRCKTDIENVCWDHHTACPSIESPTSDESRDYRWRISISKIELADAGGIGRLFELQECGSPALGPREQVQRRVWHANKREPRYMDIWSTMWKV
jgi:hypothetical protein